MDGFRQWGRQAELDAQCLHWGKEHRGCNALYKEIPVGGLFKFRDEDGNEETFRKYKSGYKLADGRKSFMFKTGQRAAVCTVEDTGQFDKHSNTNPT